MGLDLRATVSLDGSKFERGMERVGEKAAETIKGLVVGAAGVATLEMAFARTIETANELVNTSKRLGIGVEQLQVLKQAAKDAGVEFGSLAGAFEKIDIARAKALGGGADAKKYLKDFKDLGVTRDQLLNQSAAQLFQGSISSTVQKTNPEQIAGQLRDVLGKSFGPEIAVLKTNFEELGHEMKGFGAIMSTTGAVQLKAFKDEMDLISQILMSQFAPIIIFLGKALFEVVTAIGTLGTAIGNFLTEMAGFFKGGVAPAWDSMAEAKKFWDGNQELMQDFDARAKKTAEGLDHPIKPDFGNLPGAHATARREKALEGDSLIKTGNFLGKSSGFINSAINSANAQMVKHAETTAKNTTKLVEILPTIGQQWLKNSLLMGATTGFGGHGAGGHWGTSFPTN